MFSKFHDSSPGLQQMPAYNCIGYNTTLILGGGALEFDEEEYIITAIQLFVDIIEMFRIPLYPFASFST
ncbi:hypothetical protein ACTXT7_011628 [Hymenolepis weldensis]